MIALPSTEPIVDSSSATRLPEPTAEPTVLSSTQQSFAPQSTVDVGLIVGIVVGIVVLCILLAVLVVALDRERRRRRESAQPQATQMMSSEPTAPSTMYGKAPVPSEPQSLYDAPPVGDQNLYESPTSALN